MSKFRIKIKRGSEENLNKHILEEGEISYVNNFKSKSIIQNQDNLKIFRLRIGDGTSFGGIDINTDEKLFLLYMSSKMSYFIKSFSSGINKSLFFIPVITTDSTTHLYSDNTLLSNPDVFFNLRSLDFLFIKKNNIDIYSQHNFNKFYVNRQNIKANIYEKSRFSAKLTSGYHIRILGTQDNDIDIIPNSNKEQRNRIFSLFIDSLHNSKKEIVYNHVGINSIINRLVLSTASDSTNISFDNSYNWINILRINTINNIITKDNFSANLNIDKFNEKGIIGTYIGINNQLDNDRDITNNNFRPRHEFAYNNYNKNIPKFIASLGVGYAIESFFSIDNGANHKHRTGKTFEYYGILFKNIHYDSLILDSTSLDELVDSTQNKSENTYIDYKRANDNRFLNISYIKLEDFITGQGDIIEGGADTTSIVKIKSNPFSPVYSYGNILTNQDNLNKKYKSSNSFDSIIILNLNNIINRTQISEQDPSNFDKDLITISNTFSNINNVDFYYNVETNDSFVNSNIVPSYNQVKRNITFININNILNALYPNNIGIEQTINDKKVGVFGLKYFSYYKDGQENKGVLFPTKNSFITFGIKINGFGVDSETFFGYRNDETWNYISQNINNILSVSGLNLYQVTDGNSTDVEGFRMSPVRYFNFSTRNVSHQSRFIQIKHLMSHIYSSLINVESLGIINRGTCGLIHVKTLFSIFPLFGKHSLYLKEPSGNYSKFNYGEGTNLNDVFNISTYEIYNYGTLRDNDLNQPGIESNSYLGEDSTSRGAGGPLYRGYGGHLILKGINPFFIGRIIRQTDEEFALIRLGSFTDVSFNDTSPFDETILKKRRMFLIKFEGIYDANNAHDTIKPRFIKSSDEVERYFIWANRSIERYAEIVKENPPQLNPEPLKLRMFMDLPSSNEVNIIGEWYVDSEGFVRIKKQ